MRGIFIIAVIWLNCMTESSAAVKCIWLLKCCKNIYYYGITFFDIIKQAQKKNKINRKIILCNEIFFFQNNVS